MAITTKSSLKSVFSGASSLWYQPTAVDWTASPPAIQPTLDVPVKVDTLSFEQGDPTLEHYKVIGLMADWVVSSEPGDIEISFRVPTKATAVLQMAFGNDAVSTAATVNVTTGSTAVGYSGVSLVLKTNKVEGTWCIVNEDETEILVLNNATLFAKAVLDQDGKGVFAVDFNGTIVSDGSTPDIVFLTKKTNV